MNGSVVTSRAWRDGVLVDVDVTRTEVAAAAHDPSMLVWIDLLRPSEQELAGIFADLGLPPTAVEDALAPHERPKVLRHERYLYFTVYSTDLGAPDGVPGRLRTRRISGIMLPSALVTIRLDDLDLAPVLQRWEDNADLLPLGSGALVHGLLDEVVDGHFEAIQRLDDEVEALEDVLFGARPLDRAFTRTVYELRRNLVALRRVVLPMREVVNALLRHRGDREDDLRHWYDDLYDHVLRASEWTESLRDMVSSVFETQLSLQDARLNTIMKKLAGWAAIIAVPTAITGWFGQNVPYVGFGEPLGVWLSAALIVFGGAVLYAVFRRHDWL